MKPAPKPISTAQGIKSKGNRDATVRSRSLKPASRNTRANRPRPAYVTAMVLLNFRVAFLVAEGMPGEVGEL